MDDTNTEQNLTLVVKYDNITRMKWNISFFNEKVLVTTMSFPAGIKASFTRIVEMIEECGPNIGKPQTTAMGDGLFEIRCKGREGLGRSFFCCQKGRSIVILHSFIKKTQKTPKKDLDIAKKRMREVKNNHA